MLVGLPQFKALRTSFSQFFEKGTCRECCKLLPEKFGAQEVFTCIQSLRPPLPNAHVTAQQSHGPHTATPSDVSEPPDATPQTSTPHIGMPHNDPTPHNTTSQQDTIDPHETTNLHDTTNATSKELDSVATYFKAKYPESKKIRIQTLTRIAQRIVKAEQHVIPNQTGVSTSAISEDPIALAKEVYQMVNKSLSFRKNRLYFSNAVDLAAFSATQLSRGQNSRDSAFSQISKDLNVKRTAVVDAYNAGSKDLTCMEFGGPASLFYIEGSVTE